MRLVAAALLAAGLCLAEAAPAPAGLPPMPAPFPHSRVVADVHGCTREVLKSLCLPAYIGHVDDARVVTYRLEAGVTVPQVLGYYLQALKAGRSNGATPVLRSDPDEPRGTLVYPLGERMLMVVAVDVARRPGPEVRVTRITGKLDLSRFLPPQPPPVPVPNPAPVPPPDLRPDSTECEMPAAGIRALRLILPRSAVKVRAWGEDRIEVRTGTFARGDGDNNGSPAPSLDCRGKGDTQRVELRVPKGGPPDRVWLTASVPRRLRLIVEGEGGYLAVVGPVSGAEVRTQGPVDLLGVFGPIDVQTRDGTVTLDHCAGSVQIRNASGRVRLKDVRLMAAPSFVEATDGSILADLLSLNAGLTLRSTGGPIFLHLPQDCTAALDIRAHGGPIHIDLPDAPPAGSDPTHVQFRLRDGHLPVRVSATGGGVEVHASHRVFPPHDGPHEHDHHGEERHWHPDGAHPTGWR